MKVRCHQDLAKEKRLLIRYEIAAGTNMWFDYATSTLIRKHGIKCLYSMWHMGEVRLIRPTRRK